MGVVTRGSREKPQGVLERKLQHSLEFWGFVGDLEQLFIYFLFRYSIKCVCDGVNITHAEAIWILGTFRTSIIVNN